MVKRGNWVIQAKTTLFNDCQYIKKKLTGSHPGLTGWTRSRVDRVSPGQFPSGFLPPPWPVPGPGRPAGPVRVLKLCILLLVSLLLCTSIFTFYMPSLTNNILSTFSLKYVSVSKNLYLLIFFNPVFFFIKIYCYKLGSSIAASFCDIIICKDFN
jgi:hypothetical protein